MSANSKKLQALFVSSLTARVAHAVELAKADEKKKNQVEFMGKMVNRVSDDSFNFALDKVLSDSKLDYQTLKHAFSSAAITTDNAVDYVAQYAIEKIIKCVFFGAGAETRLDKYSASIIANALLNNGRITSHGADRALIRFLDADALANNDEIVKYCARVEASTGSTQKSSTRQMMRFLGLGIITKKARNETIALSESGLQFFNGLIK